MVKFIYNFSLVLSVIIMQFVLAKFFAPWGIFPNLILIVLVYTSVNKGSFSGELLGFTFGVIWDAISLDVFGARALTLTVIGYFAGKFNKKWNLNKIPIQMIIIGICSLFFLIANDIIFILFNGVSESGYILNMRNIMIIFVNMLIAPLVFILLNFIRSLIGEDSL